MAVVAGHHLLTGFVQLLLVNEHVLLQPLDRRADSDQTVTIQTAGRQHHVERLILEVIERSVIGSVDDLLEQDETFLPLR